MISISVDISGAVAVLGGLSAKLRDLSPVMQAVGEVVRASVVKNFEVGGRPKWKPSHKLFGKTLIETGKLMGSIRAYTSANGVQVGTDVPYAAIHQFGGRTGYDYAAYIPARPYLVIQDEDTAEIENIIRDYLTGGIE